MRISLRVLGLPMLAVVSLLGTTAHAQQLPSIIPLSSSSSSTVSTTTVGNYNATCLSISAPDRLRAGQAFTADVSVRNSGSSKWSGKRMFKMTADHPRWNMMSESIGKKNIAPSAIANFSLSGIAPATSGTYTLVTRMAYQGSGFGNVCQKTITIEGGLTSSSSSSAYGADLSITATPPGTIVRGTTGQISVVVRNNGPETSNGTYAIVTLPSGVTAPATGMPSGCSADAAHIMCALGSISIGQTRTISVPVTAPAIAACTPQGTTFALQTFGQQADPQSDGNRISVSTTLTCPTAATADYSVAITGPTTAINRGGSVSYAVTSRITDTTAQVPNTTLTFTNVHGLQFNAGRSSAECRLTNATTVTCDLQNMVVNVSRAYQVSFDAPQNLDCATVINATAVITSPITDTNLTNNTAPSTTVAVNCPAPTTANVGISGIATPDVTYGNQANYILTVQNAGPAAVTQASVRMNVGSALTFVANGSTSGCAMNGTNVECSNIALAVNESKSITLRFATPAATATCTNSTISTQAQITVAGVTDPELTNNTTGALSTIIRCPAAMGVGTLTITKDSTPVRTQQLLAGNVETVGRLRLKAERENISINSLVLTLGAGARSVESLELYTIGSTTPITAARVASCLNNPVPATSFCATFTAENPLTVSWQSGDTTLLIKARMKSDENGGRPGDAVQVTLRGSSANTVVTAQGVTSGIPLAMNNGTGTTEGEVLIGQTSGSQPNVDVSLESHTVTLSHISSIVGDPTAVTNSSIPVGADRTVGRFRLVARSHINSKNGLNKMRLDTVIFTVLNENVAIQGPLQALNVTDNTLAQNCTALDSNGQALATIPTGTFYVRCELQNTVTIDANATVDIALRGTITNPKINSTSTSRLRVSLDQFTDATKTQVGVNQSHMQWTDLDNGTDTTATYYWMDWPEPAIQGPTLID
jgi:Domain of unknown function DUF11